MIKFYNFLIIGFVEKSNMHSLPNQINTMSYPRKRVSSIFNRMLYTGYWIPASAGMTNIIDCLVRISRRCRVAPFAIAREERELAPKRWTPK
jgi:hypothetical protein